MLERTLFRNGMARLGAAVNIVTTDGRAGRRGFTASAVCSVTDNPPTILVCVNRDADTNAALKANRVLCVNVLAARHRALSERFAAAKTNGADRFANASDWTVLKTKAPVLRDASASIDCKIVQVKEVGGHSVFFCRAQAMALSEQPEGLIYFERGYHPIMTSA